ncbi:hypothetical protein ACOSP7_029544 [Xanthoceras sorbifolium]
MASSSNLSSYRSMSTEVSLDFSSIAKSLNFNLPVKLNRVNYIHWKALVLPAIRAMELEGFINGERLCPNKFVEVSSATGLESEMVVNGKYLIWRRSDQLLQSWLMSTLSEGLIGEVTECLSALEVWRNLERLFSQQSLAKVLQLKQQLQSVKKGSSSISEYVIKVKGFGDGLKSAGQTVTDRDLLLSVLNGLGHEYDPVVVLISSQQTTMSLYKAQYMLMTHEQLIEHLNSVSQVDISSSANLTVNNSTRNNNRGGFNTRGRGNNNNNKGKRGRGGH